MSNNIICVIRVSRSSSNIRGWNAKTKEWTNEIEGVTTYPLQGARVALGVILGNNPNPVYSYQLGYIKGGKSLSKLETKHGYKPID